MGVVFQRPIKFSSPPTPSVPPIPKPSQLEGETERSYRKRVLDWMIDREVRT